MLKFENKIIDTLYKYKNYLYFIIISILALYVRYAAKDFISRDMNKFLIPWYEDIARNGKWFALDAQVGDYNILYQTIICLFTYTGKNCVYLYKLLSGFFDYLQAVVVASFACDILEEKKFNFTFNLIYTFALFLPEIVLNSSYWGQCDSIYTSFIILSLWFLYDGKYKRAFIMLGLAFAFKLQTVFIVPFIFYYYFYKKKFSILHFLISFVVFWMSGICGFINGRKIFEPFDIYIRQTGTYPMMYLNIPSFWQIVGDNYEYLSPFAMILTVIILGIGLYTVMNDKKELNTAEQYISTAVWTLWVCVLFLPAMHERYTYTMNVLFIMLCFINKKYLKYAVVTWLCTIVTYCRYLFEMEPLSIGGVLMFILAWAIYTYDVFKIKQNRCKG